MKDRTRDWKVIWNEGFTTYFRYFFNEGTARNWIQRELLDKAGIAITEIDIVKLR